MPPHEVSNAVGNQRDERRPLLKPEADEEEAQQQKRRDDSVWRLLREAREEARVLALATVFLLLGSVASLALPRLAGELVDSCLRAQKGDVHQAKADINKYSLQVLAVLAAGGLAGGLRAWLFGSAAQRVMTKLRTKLFRRIMDQEVAFFDVTRTGELMNRLSEDTRLMKDAATVSLSIALRAVTASILGLLLMAWTSWRLTLLTMAVLPVVVAAFRTYAGLNRRYTREQLAASAQASSVAEECIGSIRTVRAFAREGACCLRYGSAVGGVTRWGLKSAAVGGLFAGIIFVVSSASLTCVFWYGSRQVVDGYISLGALNTFVLLAVFVATQAGELSAVFTSIVQALGAGRRVFELLDRQPRMPPCGTVLLPPGAPQGALLQLVEVTFAYPTRPLAPVLSGLNLQVAPGSRVALVGPSGGGKSTIVALVQRFYDPQRGAVLLEGVDIRLLALTQLHRAVALVSQEPVLFADTIAWNIAFSVQTEDDPRRVDRRQVEAAARLANAHEFIMALPQGYDTEVGERGVRLSGGQKQRIAIARALVTRPRLLLLDEATSALDAESEFQVQQALDAASQGRSVLVIAHRLSTVQDADVVALVAGGKVVEQGSHSDLLAAGGQYAALVKRQLLSSSTLQQGLMQP